MKPLWEGGRHASNGRPNNGNQPAASLCGLAPKCKLLVYEDWCIEDWITYLEREHARLGGGAVGAHMLRCFRAYYAEFLCSGYDKDRIRTWVARNTLVAWFSQLERRKEN